MIANRSQRTFTIIQYIVILIQNNIFLFLLNYIFIMEETPKITLNYSRGGRALVDGPLVEELFLAASLMKPIHGLMYIQ